MWSISGNPNSSNDPRLCKHKFEARYDTRFPKWVDQISSMRNVDINDLKERVYVRDICVYCGKVIDR